MSNQQLADELHIPIIRNFKKRKVYSSFKDNIWRADLADMQLISKYNKWSRFLLCVINLFSKYAWVVPLKDKKGLTVVNVFQSILNNLKRKPNKIWVDQGSEFYNKSFLEKELTYNEGKSVITERFTITFKNKIMEAHITYDSSAKKCLFWCVS